MVIRRIQGFQSKVVRLDGAKLIIGPIGDLGDAIDALISGIRSWASSVRKPYSRKK